MQSNRSMHSPAPTGPDRALAAPAGRLLPTSVREGDRLLRLLASLRSTLVVHLARAAAALAAHEAWHLCCYRTRTDFARERLHRDGRWLRDMIRLHEALERLPKLLPALCGDDGGRPLGQVATLVIAHVATPDTVDAWIEQGRRLSLHELRDAVATHRRCSGDVDATASRASSADGSGARVAESLDEPSAAATTMGPPPSLGSPAEEDDDPQVRMRQTVPLEVKWAFEAALDLHRCIEGGEVSVNGFVQALVAEAASSGCLPPDDFTPRFGPRSPRTSHAHAPGHSPHHEHTSGRGASEDPTDGSDASGVLALHTPAMRRALRRLSTFERLRRCLTRLDHKLQAAARKDTRTQRRDIRRIVRSTELLLRLEDGLEIDFGDLLLEMHEHEAWQALGFSGLEAYAETRLGLAGSTARRRVALARDLRQLPLVRQAYEDGDIGLMGAQWVSRGLRRTRADAETQHQWITHARAVTIKRLRQEERQRESQRLLAQIAIARANTPAAMPGQRTQPGVATPRQPDASKTSLPNSQSPTAMSSDTGTAQRSPLTPMPMDDAAWRASLRRAPGETRSRVIELGYGLLERLLRGGPTTQASLGLHLEESVAADLLGCIEAARRGLGLLAASASTPADHRLLAPSARMAGFFFDRGLRVPEWVGRLALLEEWVWVHDDPRNMTRHADRRVLERDGYRCMAPGCTSRARLHVHHLHYRSQQGSDEDWNLLTLCSYHHLQGEHGGLARVRGRAPLDTEWRLGCDELAVHYRNERRIDGEDFAWRAASARSADRVGSDPPARPAPKRNPPGVSGRVVWESLGPAAPTTAR